MESGRKRRNISLGKLKEAPSLMSPGVQEESEGLNVRLLPLDGASYE